MLPAAVACCVFLGCVSVRPLGLEAPFELGPEEGALVVHVRSNAPIVSLEFSGVEGASDLAPGEHLLLLAVAEGNYAWSEVSLGYSRFRVGERRNAGGGYTTFIRAALQPVRFDIGVEKSDFSVEAGRINYPGMLLLDRTGIYRLIAIPIDRTASALAQLQERNPGALSRYPLRYSGRARHVFLERYMTERAGRGMERPAAMDAP